MEENKTQGVHPWPAHCRWQIISLTSSSDKVLNVALALGVVVKSVSPVLAAEGLEEGAQ
jgi:hypothetical protein